VGQIRNAYRILVGKRERKGPTVRSMYRSEGNIKTDIKVMVCKDVDWVHLTQNKAHWSAVTNKLMNLRVS